jgi:phosphoenolpyruvate carboxykinase (GTP)
MWPGFGENLRVLRWILDRGEGKAEATETPIGYIPAANAIDTSGLDVSPETMRALLAVDEEQWAQEIGDIGEYLDSYGERLPQALRDELQRIQAALEPAAAAAER